MIGIRAFRTIRLLFALTLIADTALAHAQTSPTPPTTYGRAQVTEWLGADTFAVARWDGTITIFRPPVPGKDFGPVLIQALTLPASRPAEMIQMVSETTFVTSNDASSLATWVKKGQFHLDQVVKYRSEAGVANSATTTTLDDGTRLLVSGHENGYVIVWSITKQGLKLRHEIDVRSKNPIPGPLKNIRGVAAWGRGYVVTGSEDGDLVLLRLKDAMTIARLRYSQNAQRGINSVSVRGDFLLVTNCSVGPEDRNLWLYKLTATNITHVDSVNLVDKPGKAQVFDFDADLFGNPSTPAFLASTEEGLLWEGTVANDKLQVRGKTTVACIGGGAIDVDERGARAAVAAFDVILFSLPILPPELGGGLEASSLSTVSAISPDCPSASGWSARHD